MTPPEAPLDDSSANRPPPGVPASSWAWPVMWMFTFFLVTGGALYVFKSCRDLPGEALDKGTRLVSRAGEALQRVAAAFQQGTVTTTFTSYATTLSGSQFLQFATLSQHETFTRTDESSAFWGYVPLPEVIVEASAPVTYTYYLDLNARWEFLLKDGVIWVTAPRIKFNKPAVDASRITYEVKKDSHFRNTTAAMENLKSSITWMSYQKARQNVSLVRETGRAQTEKFVQTWIARSFSDGKDYPVKVRFADELKTIGVPASAGTEIPQEK